MLSRKKQILINLVVTTFFLTASVGVGYANEGKENTPNRGDLSGEYSNTSDVAGKTAVVNTDDIAGNVYGGIVQGEHDAKGNTAEVKNGREVAGDINGGSAERGIADSNKVHITEKSTIIGRVYGGITSEEGNANNNIVTVTDSSIINGIFGGENSVYGGAALKKGNADKNMVRITTSNIVESIYGGSADEGNADNNIVTIAGGSTIKQVAGGYTSTGNADNNNVTISNSGVEKDVYGGSTNEGNAGNNIVTVSASGILGEVAGGYTSTGNADNNIVTIADSTIEENIYGGHSKSGHAINNTVIIKGDNTFGSGSIIYGGFREGIGGDALTGNKLEIYRNTSGTHTVKGIQNFSNMNFYLDNSTKNGDVMLKVTDNVNIDQTAINLEIVSGEKPKVLMGDRVDLIKSAGQIEGVGKYQKYQTVYVGLETVYDFELFQETDRLGVKVNRAEQNGKVQSIPAAQMTGQSMLRMGGDTVAGQGMTAALTATKMEQVENSNDGEGGMPSISTEKSFANNGAVFATMGGGSSKYKAGGTSEVNSFNIVTGMAWRINQPKNNNLLLGAFFESGWGNYTTNSNGVDGNVRGDGSSDYVGGGILGRYEFAGGTYVEGSVRMGRVKNDYNSSDLRGANDGKVGYNTSDSYNGAHLGIGYIKKINEQTELDLYGKYLYAHQGGSSVTVVGDRIQFDPTNSHRLRLGARLSQKTTKDFNGYVGLAYEYEFDGKMTSSINYNPILAPSVKGSSGILELGVVFKPAKSKNLSIDLSVNGHVGKHQGVSGNLQFKYLF